MVRCISSAPAAAARSASASTAATNSPAGVAGPRVGIKVLTTTVPRPPAAWYQPTWARVASQSTATTIIPSANRAARSTVGRTNAPRNTGIVAP